MSRILNSCERERAEQLFSYFLPGSIRVIISHIIRDRGIGGNKMLEMLYVHANPEYNMNIQYLGIHDYGVSRVVVAQGGSTHSVS